MTLYIHIPFCSSRCGYCTFNSFTNSEELYDDYVNALILDISKNTCKEPLSSIFFGGGTPNMLETRFYEKIFAAIRQNFTLTNDCEITTEANPNLITQQWCQQMHDLGINRLSLGVQSFFTDKLAYLEREHGQKDIYYALECAQKANIFNLSIDLIYDTPLDNPKRIKEEITLATQLPISHLSAYSLSIEDDSRLKKRGEKESATPQHKVLIEALNHSGFYAYEVSNFIPKNGKKCAHNLAYWQGMDYIGCGAGAVGKLSNKALKNSSYNTDHSPAIRLQATKNLNDYITHPNKRSIEYLSTQDIFLESLFLGLRSEVGVDISLLDSKALENLEILKSHNLIEIKNNRIYALDYFLSDELALRLS